ncbi:MAG: ADP-heptose synthase [Candidatus Sericytochromatia bacterium]|nr:MAG: ADP-heptose synthase [Candidatus Sericytochromatia bacterium]GIX40805.1 MAG: ADP-heptose synthase [Leptospiraceae bacterium]
MIKLNNEKTKKIIQNFSNIKILVIGDFMLDEYIFGNVERISPEAPVPIIEETYRKHIPGGAGNVLCNLKSIGVNVYCSGIIGKDQEGMVLKQKIYDYNVNEKEFLLIETERPTTRKTRIIAIHQQVCRLDKEDKTPIDNEILNKILNQIKPIIKDVNGIIISDYDKGVVIPELIHQIVLLSKEYNIPVFVDPQVTHFSYYKNVFIVTPNHHEAGKFLGRKLNNESNKDIEEAGYEILNQLQCNFVLITRGEKGMTLISYDNTLHIPTMAQEVFDVTGAGDTVISILAASYCAGADIDYATLLSNQAAGIVVGKLGAATIKPDELLV